MESEHVLLGARSDSVLHELKEQVTGAGEDAAQDDTFSYDGYQVVRREFFAHVDRQAKLSLPLRGEDRGTRGLDLLSVVSEALVDFRCRKVKDKKVLVAALNQIPKHLVTIIRVPTHQLNNLGKEHAADYLSWFPFSTPAGAPKERIFFVLTAGTDGKFLLFRINEYLNIIYIRQTIQARCINGNLAIIKSNRRLIVIVSGSRETPVWCMIYDDLEYSQEADIFANQLKYVKPLLPYEIFMANVEAGNDDQLIIKSLVESYGLFISSSKVPGGICAVSCLEHIYKKYGFHVLDRTLRLCIGTWEGEYNSLSANMLKGIALLIVAFGNTLKDDGFKERVGKSSAREIGRTAKERKAGSLGYAEAMLLAYNKKMKAGLHWSKLHATKSTALDDVFYNEYEESDFDTVEET